eukprot:5663339-Pleurochrysis_carterae.AAC.1
MAMRCARRCASKPYSKSARRTAGVLYPQARAAVAAAAGKARVRVHEGDGGAYDKHKAPELAAPTMAAARAKLVRVGLAAAQHNCLLVGANRHARARPWLGRVRHLLVDGRRAALQERRAARRAVSRRCSRRRRSCELTASQRRANGALPAEEATPRMKNKTFEQLGTPT